MSESTTRPGWTECDSAIDMVNLLMPEHDRTSCDDQGLGNQWPNEFGYARCARCAVLSYLRVGPPYEGLIPTLDCGIRWVHG